MHADSHSNSSNYIEYKNYSLIDVGQLSSYVSNQDFSEFYNTRDIDFQADFLDNLISTMFSYVPVSRIKIKQNSDWMKCPDIVYAQSLRDIALSGKSFNEQMENIF